MSEIFYEVKNLKLFEEEKVFGKKSEELFSEREKINEIKDIDEEAQKN